MHRFMVYTFICKDFTILSMNFFVRVAYKKERDLLLCLLKDKSQVKNTGFPISIESIRRFNIVHDAVGNPHTALKQKIILTYPVSFIGYFNQIIIGASICHLTVSLSTVLMFSRLVRRFFKFRDLSCNRSSTYVLSDAITIGSFNGFLKIVVRRTCCQVAWNIFTIIIVFFLFKRNEHHRHASWSSQTWCSF